MFIFELIYEYWWQSLSLCAQINAQQWMLVPAIDNPLDTGLRHISAHPETVFHTAMIFSLGAIVSPNRSYVNAKQRECSHFICQVQTRSISSIPGTIIAPAGCDIIWPSVQVLLLESLMTLLALFGLTCAFTADHWNAEITPFYRSIRACWQKRYISV